MKAGDTGIKSKWKMLGKCLLVHSSSQCGAAYPHSQVQLRELMLMQLSVHLPSACLMRKLPASFVPLANTWIPCYSLPRKTMKTQSEDSSYHIQLGIPSPWLWLSETSYEHHKYGVTGACGLFLVLDMIMSGFSHLALCSFAYRLKKLWTQFS